MKPSFIILNSIAILLWSCTSKPKVSKPTDTLATAQLDILKQETRKPQTPAPSILDTVQVPNEGSAIGKVHLTGGVFHDGEVLENIEGLKWIGLFSNKQGYYLKSANIKTGRAKDEIVDEDNEISGWNVSTDNTDTCSLLINSSLGLQETHVDTFILKKDIVWPGEVVSVNTSKGTFTLKATGRVTVRTKEWQEVENYKLYLEGNDGGKQVKQLIVAIPRFEDAMTKILWCGDLDKDGKPDFIIDTSYHYNVQSHSLYLSSKARSGQLIKYIGTFSITGC